MLISQIEIDNTENLIQIKEMMQNLPVNKIASVNWKDQFPAKPDASFQIAHNGTHLFLHYHVHEPEIMAKVDVDNGAVWTDSCVEFFISFGDSSYYYNAEFSCIGKALLGYRKERKDVVYGSPSVMQAIKRYSSLGTVTFDKKEGDFKWDLLIVIPVSVFWISDLESFKGVSARANFYKCGDYLTQPHYLSWNPISYEKPNFHLPQFFERLNFE